MKKHPSSLITLLATFSLVVSSVMPAVSQAQTATSASGGGGEGSVSSFCYTFNQNLGIGSTGNDVSALQNALQQQGLLGTSGSDKGSYNETVAAAVSGFQERYAADILTPNGLSFGTGYVGASTRAKLNALYGCGTSVPPATGGAGSSAGGGGGGGTCYVFSNNLGLGAIGPDVVALQTWLIGNGYHIAAIESGAQAKGYYGNQTGNAVKAYQAANGIIGENYAGYGYFGPKTRAQLNAACGTTNPPVAVCPAGFICTPPNPVTSSGPAFISNSSATAGSQTCSITSGSCSQLVSFSYTMSAGTSTLYVGTAVTDTASLDRNASLVFNAKGYLVPGKGALTSNPGVIAGDTSAYYIVPAGSSRQFTFNGSADNSNCPSSYSCSNILMKVAGINYGLSPNNLSGFSISDNISNLQLNLSFNSTANPVNPPTSCNSGGGYQFYTNLTVGSSGPDVVALQTWLIANGYHISGIESGAVAKGYYDAQTQTAVSQFQAATGLPITGSVDALTRGILNSGCTTTTATCPAGYVCTTVGTTTNPVTPPPANNTVTFQADFTKSFGLSSVPSSVTLSAAADNQFLAYVNGNYVGAGADTQNGDNFDKLATFNITPYLHTGTNTIKITGQNYYSTFTSWPSNAFGLLYKVTDSNGNTITSSDGSEFISNATVSGGSSVVLSQPHQWYILVPGAKWIWDSADPLYATYLSYTGQTQNTQPHISTVAGMAASNGQIDAGGKVGIVGTNLLGGADTAYMTQVYIGNSLCTITQASNDLIYCTSSTGLNVGSTYNLYVTNTGGTSNTVQVVVLSNLSQPSSVAVSSASAVLGSPVSNGTGITSYPVTISYTLTAGNQMIYESTNNWSDMDYILSGLTAAPSMTATANPANLTGDSNVQSTSRGTGFYVIPAGSSRTFTWTGVVTSSLATASSQVFGISDVYYGTTPSGISNYSNVTTLQPTPVKVSMNLSTGSQSSNQAPVISGISGPTQLSAGTSGTWTVSASDPQNGSLSYSVNWGDNMCPAGQVCSNGVMSTPFVQQTNFTHTYASPGTYTVSVTVKNSAGLTAQSSITTNVTNPTATPPPSTASVTASLLDASSDKVGTFGNFGPGKGAQNGNNPYDWHFTATIITAGKAISSIRILSNDNWQGWSTINPANYPLVVYGYGSKVNSSYGSLGKSTDPTVFDLYGQPETTTWPGGNILVTFSDGTTATAQIAASSVTVPPVTVSTSLASASAGSVGSPVYTPSSQPNVQGNVAATWPFTFTVTAGSSLIYVSATPASAVTVSTSGGAQATPVAINVGAAIPGDTNTGLGTSATGSFVVPPGASRTFTINVTLDNSNSSSATNNAIVAISGIYYSPNMTSSGQTTSTGNESLFTSNLSSLQSTPVSLVAGTAAVSAGQGSANLTAAIYDAIRAYYAGH